jgi:hypothetical protein
VHRSSIAPTREANICENEQISIAAKTRSESSARRGLNHSQPVFQSEDNWFGATDVPYPLICSCSHCPHFSFPIVLPSARLSTTATHRSYRHRGYCQIRGRIRSKGHSVIETHLGGCVSGNARDEGSRKQSWQQRCQSHASPSGVGDCSLLVERLQRPFHD